FYEGGAGTFLTVFFKFFVEVQRRRGTPDAEGLARVATQLVNNRHAFVDQSDPSIFYLQQPTGPARDVGGGSAPSSPSRRSGSGHAEVGHAGRFPQEAQLLQQQRQQQPHIGGGSEPTSSSANPGEGSGRTSRAGDEIEMNTWGGGDGGRHQTGGGSDTAGPGDPGGGSSRDANAANPVGESGHVFTGRGYVLGDT
ncbi:unnamed protein product, partial [Amoebophrya sp. A25]